jgi:hypothetical protein
VVASWVCDGEPDCPEGKCPVFEGKWLVDKWVCDGEPDCPEGKCPVCEGKLILGITKATHDNEIEVRSTNLHLPRVGRESGGYQQDGYSPLSGQLARRRTASPGAYSV